MAALDRRCASAESALHGAATHGQVIDTIRSVLGPFREQMETRLATLENVTSGINDSLGQASTDTRQLSEVSEIKHHSTQAYERIELQPRATRRVA